VRVLIVNAFGASAEVGGTEKGIGLLTRNLHERGVAVSIVQAFRGEQLPGIPTTVLHRSSGGESRLRWFENHAGDLLSRPTAAMARAIEDAAPDLVHTHNLQGIGTGVWEICRRRDLPVYHTLHDYHLLCPRVTLMGRDGEPCRPSPVLCGLRASRMARWAGGVSEYGGVSEFLVRSHEHVFPGIPRHVVRNPIQPVGSAAHRRPSSPPRTIGYLGNLTREKGVDILLQAAPAFAALGCDLRIAGGGRLEAQVNEAAREHQNVSFDGVATGERKSEFLGGCDIGVIPSVWNEPGGPTHAMLEWLGAGRPTLVSIRGGQGEVIDDFPGAIPLEPTVEGIISAVTSLLDPAGWAQAVEAVRPITGDGEVDRWVERHLAIYRSLI
jgi:glycosyltransferase involved in cell wall biosynthesis